MKKGNLAASAAQKATQVQAEKRAAQRQAEIDNQKAFDNYEIAL